MSRDDELPTMSFLHGEVFDHLNKLLRDYYADRNYKKDIEKDDDRDSPSIKILKAKYKVLDAANTFLEHESLSTSKQALTSAMNFIYAVNHYTQYKQQRSKLWHPAAGSQTDQLVQQVLPEAKAYIGDPMNYQDGTSLPAAASTHTDIAQPTEEDLVDSLTSGGGSWAAPR